MRSKQSECTNNSITSGDFSRRPVCSTGNKPVGEVIVNRAGERGVGPPIETPAIFWNGLRPQEFLKSGPGRGWIIGSVLFQFDSVMRRSVETETGMDVLVWLKTSRPVSSFPVLWGLCLLDFPVGRRWGRRSILTACWCRSTAVTLQIWARLLAIDPASFLGFLTSQALDVIMRRGRGKTGKKTFVHTMCCEGQMLTQKWVEYVF
ncbi:hypothetical protein B0J18DRAFT_243002 [Chaetomium sp. MPI-SDFR-AT-0129]|nr:hypothetical protein B0J18DRAFT_243002 [Chaetomium sp. MPI-SDFR-AT-0129]